MNPRIPLGDRLEFLKTIRTINHGDPQILNHSTTAIFAATRNDNTVNIALGPDNSNEQSTRRINEQDHQHQLEHQSQQQPQQSEISQGNQIMNNIFESMNAVETTPTKIPKNLSKILELSPHTHLYMGILSPERKRSKKTEVRQQLWSKTPKRRRIQFNVDDNDDDEEKKPIARFASDIPLALLLQGLTQQQLIEIIMDKLIGDNYKLENELRIGLPMPDLKYVEKELLEAKRVVLKSLPIAPVFGKVGHFTKAVVYFEQFKHLLQRHIQQLDNACHWDALIDYICLAWPCARATAQWNSDRQLLIKQRCYEILKCSCIKALKNGGINLGTKRLQTLKDVLNIIHSRESKIDVKECFDILNQLL